MTGVRAVLFAAVAAAGVAAAEPATAPAAGPAWDHAAFVKAVAASGRSIPLTADEFARLQRAKDLAVAVITQHLSEHLKTVDPRVIEAFRLVPREYFTYHYQQRRPFPALAYEVPARPRGVGYGSALSDYVGQAYMTQLAAPKPGDTALEIGTGSGFQAAFLSRLVKDMYSIEIIQPLGEAVGRIFAPIGYTNVHTRVGDGYFGWPEVAGGFDLIMVTCAASSVPPPLLAQLKPGGRMIIPIGQPFKHGQVLYVYTKDPDGRVRSRRDAGVYFIPMTGAIQAGKTGAAAGASAAPPPR